MTKEKSYQTLSPEQIQALEANGCKAQNWQHVLITDGFDVACVRNAHFSGHVEIGRITDKVKSGHGLEKACGIYNADIADCTIGDNTRIANIGVHIANYDIADNVCIEDVSLMQTNRDATFGNGVEVAVLNEAGGREVILFNELSVQFAYLMCLHRHRPKLIEKLKAIADAYVQSVKSHRGKVDTGACICSTGEIIDVNIGSCAIVNGVSKLENGTILSSSQAQTTMGTEVIAENFIVEILKHPRRGFKHPSQNYRNISNNDQKYHNGHSKKFRFHNRSP